VKLVGSLVNGYYVDIIVSNQFLAATKTSRATKLADKVAALKGKRIGITGPGSGTQALVDYLFTTNGLDTTRDAELVNVGASQASIIQLLKDGRIDAVSFAWPLSMIADAAGVGKAYIMPALGDVPSMREQIQSVIYAKPDVIAKRNDMVVAFVHAVGRAEAYLHRNVGAARTMLKAYDPELNDAAARGVSSGLAPATADRVEQLREGARFPPHHRVCRRERQRVRRRGRRIDHHQSTAPVVPHE